MNFNKYIKLLAVVFVFVGFAQTAQAQTVPTDASTPSPTVQQLTGQDGQPLMSQEQLKIAEPNRDYADYLKANGADPAQAKPQANTSKAARMEALTEQQKASEKESVPTRTTDDDGDNQ